MATRAYSSEDITLLDGTDVELVPLAINNLRKFMKIWSEVVAKVQKKFLEARESEDTMAVLIQQETTEWQYDAYIKMCAICLREIKGEKTDKQFAEYLEGVLDEATIFRILSVCGNLKLGEQAPNPMTAEVE